MSQDTRDAVEEAIRAHIADEYDDPRIVTDWVVLIANQGLDDDTTGYFYISRIGMPAHTFTGLIRHHLRVFEHQHVVQATEGNDDE